MSAAQAARDAAFAQIEKQREAAKTQSKRLEWSLLGSTRDLQRLTQQQPLQLDNLITTLELALTIARDLRDVRAAIHEVEGDDL